MKGFLACLLVLLGIVSSVPSYGFSLPDNQKVARLACVPYNVLVFEEYDLVKVNKAILPGVSIESAEADEVYTIYRCINGLNNDEVCYATLDGGFKILNCFSK
jgi:hypothetical protein